MHKNTMVHSYFRRPEKIKFYVNAGVNTLKQVSQYRPQTSTLLSTDDRLACSFCLMLTGLHSVNTANLKHITTGNIQSNYG